MNKETEHTEECKIMTEYYKKLNKEFFVGKDTINCGGASCNCEELLKQTGELNALLRDYN